MSSILTNNSAMVALQTLKSVNKNLASTQSEISTGKSVATAKDNSAVWAISKVMESDVQGFKAISDSLNLGQSTVSVARQAAETVTDLLTQMKGKIVAAQEDNVDRAKINDDVTALKNQIASVVGAAQFNGLNLVDGSTTGADILASLDRDASGNVTSSSISVATQNLNTGTYTAAAVFAGSSNASAAGDNFSFALANGDSDDIVIDADAGGVVAGDRISVTVAGEVASYTITAEDLAATTPDDVVAVGLKSAIESLGIAGLSIDYDTGTAGTLTLTNSGADSISVTGSYTDSAAGGMSSLSALSVATAGDAATALGNIEALIDTAIDASAAFGSAQGRVDTQADFINKLSDSLKSGIGSMVDADMEAASARLQALQTQQQLATQSLSIANQAPQSILSLFR